MNKQKIIINIFFACFSTIINVIIQFALIFSIIYIYGVTINGFIQNAIVITSFIITARGAVSVLTSSHLYRALINKDYELANNIINTAHRRNISIGYISLGLLIVLALIYTSTIFLQDNSLNNTSHISNSMGINYLLLTIVFFVIGLKNLFAIFFTAARETLIYANRKDYIIVLIQLIAELLTMSITFYLISIKANIIFPFLFFWINSVIVAALIWLYTKQKFPWLQIGKKYKKYQQLSRDIIFLKIYQIGNILLMNCDLIIVYLILGLNVSSIFSIYMLIAVALRVMLVNCMRAWRSYYSFIVAIDGRLYWQEYRKLEFIAYTMAAFTFIIQFLFTPYLINALYNSSQLFANKASWTSQQQEVYQELFFKYNFGLFLSIITSLIIVIEPFNIMIYAKRHYPKVAIKTLTMGILNVVIGGALCLVISQTNHIHGYIWGIYAIIISEMVILILYYLYLWFYNWIYLTYSSSWISTFRNLLLWGISIVLTLLLFKYLIFINLNLTFKRVADNKIVSYVSFWSLGKLSLFLFINLIYAICSVAIFSAVVYCDYIYLYLKKLNISKKPILWKRFNDQRYKKIMEQYPEKLIKGVTNHVKVDSHLDETEPKPDS